MKISNIRKEEQDDKTLLIADVESAKFERDSHHTIWMSLPREYGEYLIDNRYDGFLVALFYSAMAYGEDIEIEGVVSEKLLYNVKEYVIHILLAYSPWLKKINISAKETTDEVIHSAVHVGTGFSGGVDSFCTVYDKFVKETNPKFKIDTLVNFNVGNYYGRNPDETDALFQQAYQRLSGYPNFAGLPYIPVNSSMAYIYNEKWNFQKVHLLHTIAGVLTMQNYFCRYYFASSIAYRDLPDFVKTYKDFDIAAFCDVFICQFLSTETLALIPDGHQYSRVEKTERISHYAPTCDFLEVAPRDETGKQDVLRPKSIRVLTTLDALDKLELYAKVFDLEKYRKHRFYMKCKQVLDYKKNVHATAIIDLAHLHGKKYPNLFVSFLYVNMKEYKQIVRRIVPERVRKILRTIINKSNNRNG